MVICTACGHPRTSEGTNQEEPRYAVVVHPITCRCTVLVLSGRAILRLRRIIRGTATGIRLTGTVAQAPRQRGRVVLRVAGTPAYLLSLWPVNTVLTLKPGEPVTVWATRQRMLSKRPRGPWVLHSTTEPTPARYAPGWLRAV